MEIHIFDHFSSLDHHLFLHFPIVFRGLPHPAGASFLTDNILGLVIDYDELRTGTRSEATFTMFASFIPKVDAGIWEVTREYLYVMYCLY